MFSTIRRKRESKSGKIRESHSFTSNHGTFLYSHKISHRIFNCALENFSSYQKPHSEICSEVNTVKEKDYVHQKNERQTKGSRQKRCRKSTEKWRSRWSSTDHWHKDWTGSTDQTPIEKSWKLIHLSHLQWSHRCSARNLNLQKHINKIFIDK